MSNSCVPKKVGMGLLLLLAGSIAVVDAQPKKIPEELPGSGSQFPRGCTSGPTYQTNPYTGQTSVSCRSPDGRVIDITDRDPKDGGTTGGKRKSGSSR